MLVKLNILCINIQCIQNYAKLDYYAWILPHFSLKQTVKITAMYTQLVQAKFNMGTPRLDNDCQSF